ncbi:NUDIX hydrolase [Deinococcus sonorensis]|uniref:NUDIX hydrolase n=2 Tax=Deinococcus sonorensis TaxID=309891 RepID=A0AAU7U7Z9_9DEIO
MIEVLRELMSIAQAGLTYTRDPYDVARYEQLQRLTARLMAEVGTLDAPAALDLLQLERGYLTPKLDVRAVVVQAGRVLLTRERQDGRWSLPGGWADPGEGPGQIAVRETLEETGYPVRALRLLAVLDKDQHGHPPDLWSVWKVFVACELTGEPQPQPDNIETLESGFFTLDELPPLSLGRNTPEQVRRMVQRWGQPDAPTEFD